MLGIVSALDREDGYPTGAWGVKQLLVSPSILYLHASTQPSTVFYT